jgi:hypothetical protein
LFYAQQRYEKEAEVVIHLLGVGLVQTAPGATPRGAVQGFGSGLHSGNDKTHAVHLLLCSKFTRGVLAYSIHIL